MNFGDIPEQFSSYDTAKIVILPVPFDTGSTWIKGADKGPLAMIEASANMELYDISTNKSVYELGIHTAPAVEGFESAELLSAEVYKRTLELLADSKFPVLIGGNHSITIGAARAMAESYKHLTVLQFDAHADLRQEYEGSPFNHACVMARAKETAPICQVGIRSMSEEETGSLDSQRVFFAHKIAGQRNWHKKALKTLSRNVYITIDLDVFDPSVMPSTGTPEPGGLYYYEVLSFIRKVAKKHRIVGFDINELCPNPANKAPDFMASKLLYQTLSYIF